MRPALKISVPLILLAAVGYGGWRLLASPVSHPPAVPAPVPVAVAQVQRRDVAIVMDGLGTVTAQNTAVIRTQVAGVLQSVDFTEGQAVRRGDRLAQVDPRPNQAKLDQAEAQLARDTAHLSNARVNLGRNMPLLRKGYATAQSVADQASQVSQLGSQIKSDVAAVEDARTQLGYTALTAPFDGVTGVRAEDVGNVIHPTDATGLVTITQVQPITVLITLPASAIPSVQDAIAAGTVPAVAFDQAGTRPLDKGRLLLINNQADPTSGTVQLKAEFPNLHRLLWPGTFVNVALTLRTVKGGLVIPTNAVQQGAAGTFVFLVPTDHKVSVRQVTVIQRRHGVALVSRGLQAGETIVVQGQYRLVPGTVVAAVPPDQVAASSAASAGLLP